MPWVCGTPGIHTRTLQIAWITSSGVTKGLSQGEKLSWKRPTGHSRRPTSQHSEKNV